MGETLVKSTRKDTLFKLRQYQAVCGMIVLHFVYDSFIFKFIFPIYIFMLEGLSSNQLSLNT